MAGLECYYDQIKEYVDLLPIIDMHEHLLAHEADRNPNGDFFTEYLSIYFQRDLISSGMPKSVLSQLLNSGLDICARWALVEPYWNRCRNTGYGRSLDIAVKGIYDLEGIRADTVEELDRRFKASMDNSHYERVLHEKSNILMSILDNGIEGDRRYFRCVFRMDEFMLPKQVQDLERAQLRAGMRVHGFADWLDACDKAVDDAVAAGCVGYKTYMAYERSLLVGRSTYQEAESCFNDFYKSYYLPDWDIRPILTTKAYQDYMLHHILRRVANHDLIVQVHTGFQEGNGNLLSHADPTQLCQLLLEYPDLRFDLMHIGYPYQMALSAIGKQFQNANLDMCWAHIVSPNASRNALLEWLDAVPVNKIMAFGGDYSFVDGVYGHQRLARDNVSAALAVKVLEGSMDLAEARRVARMILLENPYELFGLKRAGVSLPRTT